MSDPKRLLDETRNGDLAKLLSAGRSETPDQAQLGALAAKLGVLGGIGGLGGGGAAAGAAGGGGGSAGSVGSAGGAASAGVKAGLAVKIGSAIVIASAAGATAVVATSTHETPRAPVGIVATGSPSVAATAVSGVGSGLRLTPLDEAPFASAPTTQMSAPRPSTSVSPEAEVRLLERAQDALRSRPVEALALADDHARQFPRGMLVQEREVIAIEALMKLWRTSEAQARAARFKARFPGSSHTRRIDTLVGETGQ